MLSQHGWLGLSATLCRHASLLMPLLWLCVLQGFVAAALEHFWSSGVKDDKQVLTGAFH
jgi:hypothetical protein